ncbi:hypothetical protein [Streptomyces sp. NPDC004296]|uniref:hypothetical protein n=1 Tax=Streptomyces sp. NPDC004296 TaxID=3364697 RepID=UPI0036A881E5
MSHSQADLRRPGTLNAAVACSIVSALAAFAGALVVFAGGRQLAERNIEQAVQESPQSVGLPAGTTMAELKALSKPVWEAVVGDRFGTLVARGVLASALGLCLLVFGLYAGRATVWSRVMTTVSAVAAVPVHALVWFDFEPASVTATTLVALATAVAAVVLAWLPPNGRYAAQLGNGKRNAAVPQPAGAVSG